MITIEHGIPVPAPAGLGRPRKYPLPAMKVGDSFFANHGTTRTTLTSCIRHYVTSQAPRKRFVTRLAGTGYRVWRTK